MPRTLTNNRLTPIALLFAGCGDPGGVVAADPPPAGVSGETAEAPVTEPVETLVRRGEFRKAVTKAERLHDEVQGRSDASSAEIMEAKTVLATAYERWGDLIAAERLLGEAVREGAGDLGLERERLVPHIVRLARFCDRYPEYNYRNREWGYRRALEILEEKHGETSVELLPILNAMAAKTTSYFAAPILKRSLTIARTSSDADSVVLAERLAEISRAYWAVDETEPGLDLMYEALGIFERTLGADTPETILCVRELAAYYNKMRRFDEAEPLLQRVMASLKSSAELSRADRELCQFSMATLRLNQQDLVEAEAYYRELLDAVRRDRGADHPDVAPHLRNLAALHQMRSELNEAERLLREALRIQEGTLILHHEETEATLQSLRGGSSASPRAATGRGTTVPIASRTSGRTSNRSRPKNWRRGPCTPA